MKTTNILLAVLIVVILGGGLWWFMTMSASQSGTQTPVATTTDTSSNSNPTSVTNVTNNPPVTIITNSTTTTTTNPPAQSFKVNGNDAGADLTTIAVPKGTQVTITFGADAGTTYHGGLDFRSSVVSTGTITPGSTKTVTFTAVKSFAFTPYWPATNIAKPYTIKIVVQ